MPWVKFTDDWYDDEDMADASPLALAMWAVAITWSARNLTDGRIPRSVVRKLLDLEHDTLAGLETRADDLATELVQLGKWTANDRGFTISNYHRYQPTRAKVIADREKDRKRKKSRSGDLLADDTNGATGHTGPETVPDGIPPEPEPPPDWNPDCPVPVPEELSVLSSSGNSRGNPPPVDNPNGGGDDPPDATWTRYAELMLERQPAGAVKKPRSWKDKTASNARTELADQARHWWRTFNVQPHQLAAWLIDGQPGRYAQRRENTQEPK